MLPADESSDTPSDVVEVTRLQLKDPAGGHHCSFFDQLRSMRVSLRKNIDLGKHVIIRPHVDFRLTDNAQLIIEDFCTIDSYALFQLTKPEPTVHLGKYVGIGRHSVIAAKRSIRIGDFSQLGPYCQINDQGHGTAKGDLIMNQRAVIEPVSIGRDCWLGSGVRVLKAVTIGDGAIVGAGSVVTKDIPPYEIWAGVPARKIRNRE